MAGGSPLDRLYAKAVALQTAGAVADAIKIYDQILKKAPEYAGALHMLGFARYQQGDKAQAIALIQKALAVNPQIPQAYYHLGVVLQSLGRFDDAIRIYEHASIRLPDSSDLWINLGSAYFGANRLADAQRCYERASRVDPTNGEIYYNMGVVHQALNRLDEARALYERSIALKPNSAGSHLNIGNVLQALGRNDEAIEHYQSAIALSPDFADAYMNLGNALQALNRFEEAVRINAKAAALKPNYALAQMNFGSALQVVGRYEDAIRCYAKALVIDPKLAAAQMNYGTALQALTMHDEALSRYDKAIAMGSDFAEAKWNKSLLCLALGRFDEGWELYEQRWPAGIKGMVQRKYPQPRWDGKHFQGTLLLWGEQGLGDQIVYASMLHDVVGSADRILVEIEPRLVPLFTRSFPSLEFIEYGPELYPGPIDKHEPLVGLGRFFRRTWNDFPNRETGYLRPDPERTRLLRERLRVDERPVVGLSWRSHNPRLYRAKTARLEDFESLLRDSSLRFVDLQYGDTSEERRAIEDKFGVRVERLEDVDNTLDIDGLAALISACDFVVTVSNTTAHLAGALGIPTWVLVPRGNARLWYWFTDKDHCPWYPHVQLRRKSMQETWTNMVDLLVDELPRCRMRV